ncbi:MAG: type II toxin-antitoxin system death-on-curing family toxin [Terrimicrobiaceae bacterium]
MTEPLWITLEDCLCVHDEMLARFGGLSGTRDSGLLESALAKPRQLFCFGNPSLFDCAASYASGIVKNLPFLDGNKRAGFMAAALFLETNGLKFQAPEEHVVLQTLALASGKIDERDYSLWLADTCVEDR